MKYPNPTFLNRASGIKHTRRNVIIIVSSVLAFIALILVFVFKLASDQKKYAKEYPELVGAATATTTETSEEESSETTVVEETTTAETSALGPIIQDTSTTPESSEQTNSPDAFVEGANIYFYNSHALQTVSHEERDTMLDDLKQQVIDYIAACEGERICFRYVSLSSNETLGINDLDPILPAGAFALPVEIEFYNQIESGAISPLSTVTYDGSVTTTGPSYITENYALLKQFFLRTISNYAIVYNDSLALSIMINSMGGLDAIIPNINEISGYVDYNSSVNYTAYDGTIISGSHRSSAYDLAEYANYLYRAYINEPTVYQSLINDMYYSAMPSSYSNIFGEDALILHASGRNDTYHAYTDIAIIDSDEPFVLCIYVECASAERAAVIQADLATYVERYITACHT